MTVKSINQDKCIGCGECEISCPMDVIRLNKKTEKSEILYVKDCQTCHLCELLCPVTAITMSKHKCEPELRGWM